MNGFYAIYAILANDVPFQSSDD